MAKVTRRGFLGDNRGGCNYSLQHIVAHRCEAPEHRPDPRGQILADDLGYGDPGCYNPNSKVPMPAVNAMAARGVRFTDAHSPSAVCRRATAS